MTEQKMMPCPFCGASTHCTNEEAAAIECSVCEARGPARYSVDAALTAWNKRLPPEGGEAKGDLAAKIFEKVLSMQLDDSASDALTINAIRAILSSDTGGDGAYERGVNDMRAAAKVLCSDCPPQDYSTDKTRCAPCPRRALPSPTTISTGSE